MGDSEVAEEDRAPGVFRGQAYPRPGYIRQPGTPKPQVYLAGSGPESAKKALRIRAGIGQQTFQIRAGIGQTTT